MGMGDGSVVVQASNVLDNYTYILFDDTSRTSGVTFRCSTGLGPTGTTTNSDLGDIYFNNMALSDDVCNNGFIQPRGAVSLAPGIYNVFVCGTITISSEGIYTCTLRNSSMMDQSVSIGLYFSVRSEYFVMSDHFVKYISLQLLQ